MIRSLQRLVTSKQVPQPLLGRSVQEALCLHTQKLLASAADKFAESFGADELLLMVDRHEVSRLMKGGFHAVEGDK